jgi:hypothetical protein
MNLSHAQMRGFFISAVPALTFIKNDNFYPANPADFLYF